MHATPSSLRLGLTLVPTLPNDDPVPVLLALDAALVGLAERDGELRTGGVELEGRDRGRVLGELAQALLGEGVPDGDGAVAAAGCEGAVAEGGKGKVEEGGWGREGKGLVVLLGRRESGWDEHGVEGEALDGVDGVDAFDDLAVALERVLLRLRRRGRVEELDGYSPFDRRRGVPCSQTNPRVSSALIPYPSSTTRKERNGKGAHHHRSACTAQPGS